MDNYKIRTFFAIHIPLCEDALSLLGKIKNDFAGVASWTKSHQFHVTLRFLGDTPLKDIQPLSEIVEKVCQGIKPFSIRLRNLGYFGKEKNPKVLWVGLDENQQLQQLHEEIVLASKFISSYLDKKEYHPHMTLARIKKIILPKNMEVLFKKYSQLEAGEYHVNNLIFFESQLSPQGAFYKELRRFEFYGKD